MKKERKCLGNKIASILAWFRRPSAGKEVASGSQKKVAVNEDKAAQLSKKSNPGANTDCGSKVQASNEAVKKPQANARPRRIVGPQTFGKLWDVAIRNTRGKKYAEALAQWSEIRELRPDYAPAYIEAVNILAAQKKFKEAEKLCDLGLSECAGPNIGLLIAHANIKNLEKDFPEAIRRWAIARELFPDNPSTYVRAANAHRELKQYDAAMQLCQEALRNCSIAIDIIHITMALIRTEEKNYPEALKLWAEVRKLRPDIDVGYRRAALIHIELGQYDQADRLCEEAIEQGAVSIDLYRMYIRSALKKDIPQGEKLRELFERRLLLCNAFPNNFKEFILLANACHALKKYNHGLDMIGNYFATSIFEKYNAAKVEKKYEIDSSKFPKICFFSSSLAGCGYWIPVIKYICSSLVDIVIEHSDEKDRDLVKGYDIEDFNILYGLEHARNYDFIVLDSVYMEQAKYYSLPGKFIILPRNITACPPLATIGRSHLCIAMSAVEYSHESILALPELNDKNIKLLANIDLQARCELTHTGPYHVGRFLRDPDEKDVYKHMLANRYDWQPEQGKPVIVMYDDDICDALQFVECANKLASFANVVICPTSDAFQQFRERLKKEIFVFQDLANPDIPRYSADLIVACMNSNELATSLMLGLNVIACYSKTVKVAGVDKTYEDFVHKVNPGEKMRAQLLERIRPFDLQDIDAISKIVVGGDKAELQESTTTDLQKDIFGDCLLNEAAHMTAEYIIRFALNGTIGKGCRAVSLREQYFR